MKSISVPESFLSLTRELGVPDEIAARYFQDREIRLSTAGIAMELWKKGYFSSLGSAGSRMGQAYTEFKGGRAFPTQDYGRIRPVEEKPLQTYYDQAFESLQKIIGRVKKPTFSASNNVSERVVILADPHIPFMDYSAFNAVMNDPADTIILAGDWLDMYSTSRYRREYTNISTEEELAQGRAALETVASRFRNVYMIKGNHDQRPRKRLQEIFPEILPLMIDPVDLLARDMDNVHLLSMEVPNTAPNVKFGQNVEMEFAGLVGDVLIGHFEGFCGADAAQRSAVWLDQWAHVLKLPVRPTVVVQAHTHRLNSEYTPDGRVFLAPGCLARPMSYQISNHGKYIPPTLGYVAFEMSKNRVDRRSIEMIPLG